MTVTSLAFLIFAATVCLVYNLSQRLWWRKITLFAANLLFLASFSVTPVAYIPFAAFLLAGYFCVRLMRSPSLRYSFGLLILAMIGVFVWLKKYTFLPESSFLTFNYVTIGLSYIFFRILHLIIDVHSNNLRDDVGLLEYLNYTLNFTTLLAGPIQWYPDFAASQLRPVRPPLNLSIIAHAVERIIIGVCKVRVLSKILFDIHKIAVYDLSVDQPLYMRATTAAIMASSYSFYLYFNFAGYTDLVIGVAQFIRLTLPENFDRPFSSLNFIEFWSRWHMTLSRWLKTYVYTPLVKVLMKRFQSKSVEPFLGVVGFFFTFFLIGLWHGQSSEFVLFGFLQGFGVSMNKLYQVVTAMFLGRKRYKALAANAVYQALARGLTFTWLTFTLLWFWSNWGNVHNIAGVLGARGMITAAAFIWIGATAGLAMWEALRKRMLSIRWHNNPVMLSASVRTAWTLALLIFVLMVASVSNTTTPILYQIF
jgi:alginate O-acetyltransferase complex protein AlgI